MKYYFSKYGTRLAMWFAGGALILMLCRFAWLKGGTDNGLFYYAARAILSGHNPYDRQWVFQEWIRDGSPRTLDPHSFSGYINPPSLAVFYVPVLLFKLKFAYYAIVALNLIAALGLAIALPKSSKSFTKTHVFLFAGLVLLLPAIFEIIQYGQSSLISFALLAGGLLSFSRSKQIMCGALLGLSLSKFTLTLPFILYLAACRQWKAFTVAVITFTVLNLFLILPAGVPQTLTSYKALLSVESGENASYDPMTKVYRYRPDLIINAKRASVLIVGRDRLRVSVLNWILSGFIIGGLVYLRASKKHVGEAFSHPLETPLLMLAGLLLFYHRHYDLAGTLFVIFGLADYGLKHPERRSTLWKIAISISLLLVCPVFFQLNNPFSNIHPLVGLIATHYYAPFELCILFILIWTIRHQDGKGKETYFPLH